MGVVSGRACPGCGADLTGTHGKRKWCSEACRQAACYGGECETCGAKTNGSAGPGKAPRHCGHCAPTAHAKWPPERILQKIREWADLYGEPPGCADWNPTLAATRGGPNVAATIERFEAGDWPWYGSVTYNWPRWNDAIRAAGLTPREAGRGRKALQAAAS